MALTTGPDGGLTVMGTGNSSFAGNVGIGADYAPLAPGVDALLLAMKGPQARALMPQLALAGINAATRVATSQITSGTGKPAEDAAGSLGSDTQAALGGSREVAGVAEGGERRLRDSRKCYSDSNCYQ